MAAAATSRSPRSEMRYVSTRGGAGARRFTEILLEGLAADGGLYVPESLPRADLASWRNLSYRELARAVLSPFMDDVPGMQGLIEKTYTGEIFGSAEITPLETVFWNPSGFPIAMTSWPTRSRGGVRPTSGLTEQH